MKGFLTILLLLLMPAIQFGQKLYGSQPVKFNYRNQSFEILEKHESTNYLHVYGKRDHEIYAFRENMGLKWHKFIGFDNKKYKFSKLFFKKGLFYFMYTQKVKRDFILYAKLYDANLTPQEENYLIDTFRQKGSDQEIDLQYLISENREKGLIFFIEQRNNDNATFHYVTIDTMLQVLKRGELNIPTKNKKATLEDVLLSNKGEIHLILGEYRTPSLVYARRFWILSSENNFEVIAHKEIKTSENKYLNNTKFKIDNNNNAIVIVGYFSEGHKQPPNAVGIFYKAIPLDSMNSTLNNFQYFPKDMMIRLKGVSKKNSNRLYTFDIQDILLRQDGGAVIIAESYEETVRYYTSPYTPGAVSYFNEVTESYYYDEIIVSSISPEGNIDWSNIILKNQYSSGDDGKYSSYILMNNGGFLNFVFNDNISLRTNIINQIVKADGSSEKEILFNSKAYDLFLMPRFGKQVSTGELIIPSLKNNNLVLIKINYKE
jgi:hypothetical protein